jgi:general secretion pathway protein F
MSTFSYAAYTLDGRHVDGQIEAASAAQAAELLHKRGLLSYRTTEVSGGVSRLSFRRRAAGTLKLSEREYAGFTRQLATLLQADLPLDQCLRLVASQSAGTRVGTLAERLQAAVVAGQSLSDAFETELPNAPLFITPLIRAGEARGTLTPCLMDLARILERRLAVQQRFRGALVYPGVLLFVALLTVALVMGVLVPTLLPLFTDSGVEPPWVLRNADRLAQFMRSQWPLVLAVGALVVWLLRIVWRQPATRLRVGGALVRLPLVGTMVAKVNVATMARSLGTLLRNGVPLIGALSLSASVMPTLKFREALERATQAVKEGSRLAAALQRTGAFPELALRFVAIGEEASKLDDMLMHLAEITDGEIERQVETLLTLLTPAITLVLGGMVGGMILSVMQAILSVNAIALQ